MIQAHRDVVGEVRVVRIRRVGLEVGLLRLGPAALASVFVAEREIKHVRARILSEQRLDPAFGRDRVGQVAAQREQSGLRVRVADDGHGLPPQPRPETTGLLAMENRAATIGATLLIDPRPAGRGTVVQLDVPLDHNGGSP